MNTVIVLLVAAIFFAIMGYKYPKTTVVCLILAVLTPNAELLNAFIFYSFFIFLRQYVFKADLFKKIFHNDMIF